VAGDVVRRLEPVFLPRSRQEVEGTAADHDHALVHVAVEQRRETRVRDLQLHAEEVDLVLAGAARLIVCTAHRFAYRPFWLIS